MVCKADTRFILVRTKFLLPVRAVARVALHRCTCSRGDTSESREGEGSQVSMRSVERCGCGVCVSGVCVFSSVCAKLARHQDLCVCASCSGLWRKGPCRPFYRNQVGVRVTIVAKKEKRKKGREKREKQEKRWGLGRPCSPPSPDGRWSCWHSTRWGSKSWSLRVLAQHGQPCFDSCCLYLRNGYYCVPQSPLREREWLA